MPPTFETPEARARALCATLYPGNTLELAWRIDNAHCRVERFHEDGTRLLAYEVSTRGAADAWSKVDAFLGLELDSAADAAVTKALPGHPCFCHLRPFHPCPLHETTP